MAQYIPKEPLVVEIERLEERYKKCPTRNSYEEGLKEGRLIGYKNTLNEIDTLEGKEVDLNKYSEITWNDVSLLRHIMAEYRREVSNGMLRVMNEDFCKEVLKRFKALKGE